MLLQAVNSGRGSVPSALKPAASSSLLLTENQQSIGGPPALMEKLSLREREMVLAFFEKVTVNDPDKETRARRLNLLARFRDAVHQVADFSKIEG